MNRRWQAAFLFALLLVGVGLGTWHIEARAGATENDADGLPQPSNLSSAPLKTDTWDWEQTLVDPYLAGAISLALDSANTPHISYHARDEYGYISPVWKYAVKEGDSWVTETIRLSTHWQTVYSSSLVLDEDGLPHIVFGDISPEQPYPMIITHAFKQAEAWQFEEVEVIEGACTATPTFTLLSDSSGGLHLFYLVPMPHDDGCHSVLKYARREGANSWQVSTLIEKIWSQPSIIVDREDNFHIAYTLCDATCSLHYSEFGSVDEFSPTIIFEEEEGQYIEAPSIALDSLNTPHIVFGGDAANYSESLYVAHQETTGWNIEGPIRSLGILRDTNSFFDMQGNLHVFVVDFHWGGIYGSSTVAEHYYKTQDGWQLEELTRAGSTSFALDSYGNIHGATGSYSLTYFYKSINLPTYSISGQVTTQDGTPLPDVSISTATGQATTDADGNYTITSVPAGTYNVGPTMAGYSFIPATKSVIVPSDDATEVDFVAYPQGAYSISGKVVLEDGTPLEGVKVLVGSGNGDITDKNGQYAILALDAQTYEVHASLAGYEFEPTIVSPYLSTDEVNLIAGLTEYDFDMGFRSQPDGYRFRNKDVVPASGDFTLLDLQRLRGDDNVCLEPNPNGGACLAYRLYYRLLYSSLVDKREGSCFGMAATSLRYYRTPYLLLVGKNHTFDLEVSEAQREIAFYQMAQYVYPISAYKRQHGSATVSDVLSAVRTALDSGQGVVLAMQHVDFVLWTSGHAIMPYALEDAGNNVWHVMVYDNNHPSPYESERYLEINLSTDTWSYEIGPGELWSGSSTDHSLYTIPLSLFSGQADSVSMNNELGASTSEAYEAKASVNEIWSTGDGHLLITDSQGRRIGFEGNELVNEIPGAVPVIPVEGPDISVEPIYEIPANDRYTILLNGQTLDRASQVAEPASITQYGTDFLVSVDNIPVTASTQDQLTIAANGSEVVYETSQFIQPDLTLVLEEEASSSQFKIAGADIGLGQSVSLKADRELKQLMFAGSDTNSGTYDLTIMVVDATAEYDFQHSQIAIGAGDTHYIDYSQWRGTGPITLQVDEGSNGTIDEEYELGEENTLHRLLLPMVSRGR